jgi:2-polyprenyl-6-methoxyphenol hydroxylase-like FAD-dependent oxidoreductase
LLVGGGIAGLASAIALCRSGWHCTILEQQLETRRHGHGMLLPPAGRQALESLVGAPLCRFSTEEIDSFELCSRDGFLRRRFPIGGSLSVLHRDLLSLLHQALPASVELQEETCTALELGEGGRYRVVGATGQRWEADLIVAADGIRSACRASLFPEARLTPELVMELVMVVRDTTLAQGLQGRCRKFHDPAEGLALGLVPCRDGQVVLYTQLASQRHPAPARDEVPSFLWERFGHWNPELGDLLRNLDGSNAHLWRTADLDPLPRLYARNAVLVGDSAHPMLPFTSQGAASALQDALTLAAALACPTTLPQGGLEDALADYSATRLPQLQPLLLEGRALRRRFLDPETATDGLEVPLAGVKTAAAGG